jgi:hypothetical protein
MGLVEDCFDCDHDPPANRPATSVEKNTNIAGASTPLQAMLHEPRQPVSAEVPLLKGFLSGIASTLDKVVITKGVQDVRGASIIQPSRRPHVSVSQDPDFLWES